MRGTPIRERAELVVETDRYDRQIRQSAHYWEGLLLSDGPPRKVHWECSNCGRVIISESTEKPPAEGCTYGC